MKMMTQIRIGIASFALAACAGDPSHADEGVEASSESGGASAEQLDEKLNLLAQVELPGSRTVKFYEPTPGVLLKRDYGKLDAPHLPGEKEVGNAVELYEL